MYISEHVEFFDHFVAIKPGTFAPPIWRTVDVNARDAKNSTALLSASEHCQVEALEMLIDKKAAVDQLVPPPGPRTYLGYAILGNLVAYVEIRMWNM